MKYEVDCVFGELFDSEDADLTPGIVMNCLSAVYETAARQGGRIIGSHTMHLGIPRREYLFLVTEIPDELGAD